MRKSIMFFLGITLVTSAVAAPFSSTKSTTKTPPSGMAYPTPIAPNPPFSADKFKSDVNAISKQNKSELTKQFDKILPKQQGNTPTKALPYDPDRDTNTPAVDQAKPTPTPTPQVPSNQDIQTPPTTTVMPNTTMPDSSSSYAPKQPQDQGYSGFGTKPPAQAPSTGNTGGDSNKSGGWNIQY